MSHHEHNAAIRTAPHSAEAEEYLLSCCLLDGSETIARCLDRKLWGSAFYIPANRIIYEHITRLYQKAPPVTIEILAEELRQSGQLEEIGGFAYLMQVSQRVPTTAQTDWFIDRVSDLYVRRQLIRMSAEIAEDCHVNGGGDFSTEELVAKVETSLRSIVKAQEAETPLRPITSFEIQDDNDDAVLLGHRYLCRGHAALLVSGSGMGKSALAYQASIMWSLGKPFMGIRPRRPLISLHIQSEDDDGDIAEVYASVVAGMNLTPDQQELISQRVIIETDDVSRGERFLRKAAKHIARVKPDLVWLNPLQAFMDGDLKDSQAIGQFCREGLNALNHEKRFAWMIVHHTTKPSTAKDVKERNWNEIMYDMAGGADLINYARTILILKATAVEGHFNLLLAKRGKRAGVVEPTESGTWEVTTKIPLRHSRRSMVVGEDNKELPMVFWEPRETDPQDTTPPRAAPNKGGAPSRYLAGEMCYYFPASTAEPDGFNTIYTHAKGICGISKSTFSRLRSQLMEDGLVRMTEDGGYLRTPKGDAAADEFLKARP